MKKLLYILLFSLPSLSFSAPISVNLHEVKLIDLARVVYGDLLHRSYTFDSAFTHSPDDVSVNWEKLPAKQIETLTADIFSLHGFELQQVGKVLNIRKTEKADSGLFVYVPRFRSARYLSDVLKKVADANQLGSRGLPSSGQFQQVQGGEGTASAQVDKSAPDQLAYECNPVQCARYRSLLVQLDTVEAQVMLRAAIYEVGTTKGQGSAIQIAASLFKGGLTAMAGASIAGAPSLHLAGSNLDAVFTALDSDSRFKVVSRPMLRVKTGGNAKFSVGQQVPVLGAVTMDNKGNAVQSVEYRQSGTIFTVSPDVRADLVDLSITQELSSFVATTTGVNNSPTMLQRTASSQLQLKDGEVVVFAGLEESKDDDTESRFLGFTLGNKKNENSSEVLVFIEAQRI